ncbi:MAG TPA: SGNH/GDSL hydrolase family protein [Acidobacteriaceae bacterium]|nr:SGNH/GDSL hydrolase family protein [Acidobacteriaceae bacterium]
MTVIMRGGRSVVTYYFPSDKRLATATRLRYKGRMTRCQSLCLAIGVWFGFLPACRAFSQAVQPYDRMYVFGDSYSDIGEGYLDGNGPTAVAYFAERLGFPLMRANDPAAAGKSLDFAISGAQTGSGAGRTVEGALFSVGMRNQVDDFAARVRSHAIAFHPETTLFYLAGGLNDRLLPSETTVSNLEGEIRTLYSVGGRKFLVALLPTAIPAFSAVGLRLDPALARIPSDLEGELKGAQIRMSNWGPFFDEVMLHPGRYGIQNTTEACAGRAIFHEDTTPCSAPATYFYYHKGHPSTAVHKVVGDKLYAEAMGSAAASGGGK